MKEHAVTIEDEAKLAWGGVFLILRGLVLGVTTVSHCVTSCCAACGVTCMQHTELIRHAAPVGGEEEQYNEV